MPLVTNSLGADTQTHTQTQAYRHSWTEAILRNQVCTCENTGKPSGLALAL